MRDDLKAMGKQLKEAVGGVSRLNNQFGSMESRMSKMENRAGNLESRVGNIATGETKRSGEKCGKCGKWGHSTDECRSKKQDE